MKKQKEFIALLDKLKSFKYDYDMPPELEDAIDDVAYDLLIKFNEVMTEFMYDEGMA